jgi:serine/threonine protein kinase
MDGRCDNNDIDWNKIKIIKKLGEGSMGQVWLVHYEISEG